MNGLSKTLLSAAVIFAAVAFLPACGKKAPEKIDTRIPVSINTLPSEASIAIDGNVIGKSPLKGKMNPGKYLVRASAKGYVQEWKMLEVLPSRQSDLLMTLSPVTAGVMIESTPSGAEVTFNGKPAGATPVILTGLAVGQYSATLSAPGFSKKKIDWTVEDPRPQRFKAELVSSLGELEVISNPGNAALFIDGKPSGKTIYKGSIEQGTYRIRLEKEGFSPYEYTAVVNSGQLTTVEASMAPLPADMNIISDPTGANVIVNGKHYGVTPLALSGIPAGKYTVRLEKQGYDPASSFADLAPGKKLDLSLKLESNTGTIEVVTSPAGISVYLNGKLAGKTIPDPGDPSVSKALRISGLQPDTYTLVFRHKRATPSEAKRQVRVERGKVVHPKNVDMWVPNATLKMASGATITGRLIAKLKNGEHVFEAERGIRIVYKGAEVASVTMIKEDE